MIALQREELYLHPSEDTDKLGRATVFLSPPTSLQNPHSFFVYLFFFFPPEYIPHFSLSFRLILPSAPKEINKSPHLKFKQPSAKWNVIVCS